nr:MAG TPA: hypothetical protein [Caudoviricetes sp.]
MLGVITTSSEVGIYLTPVVLSTRLPSLSK